ncbi:acyl-CoA thioesterase [Vibrio sp. S11_S32]|uniref:acyl-CoA thioesterase n=1 Tax=Vibrio sp. S11_S32 TaxID=2720225 RepID=UPI001680B964|nr:acyl-CoA thioesterase [Vibrio sp. S11_S32]MBD1575180.1 acyl-CoA thioesterase [Vibrio sp. S11_S32]
MTEKTLSASVIMTPSFQDADPMGVVYHGNYFRFFEEARRVMLDKIGYNYRAMEASGYMWPIIDVRVKYIKPIPFDLSVRVEAKLTEWENRLKVDYVIYNAESGVRLTKGYTMQVAVDMQSEEMCFTSPKAFTDKLEIWHAQ